MQLSVIVRSHLGVEHEQFSSNAIRYAFLKKKKLR